MFTSEEDSVIQITPVASRLGRGQSPFVVTRVPVTGLWSLGPENNDPDAMAGNRARSSETSGLETK